MTVVVPPPVDAVVAAINRGDTETFLAAFTADGAIYSGHDEIAARNAREKAAGKTNRSRLPAGRLRH